MRSARVRLGLVTSALGLAGGLALAGAESLERGELLERPLVTGRSGMVTSLHPLASMAGMQLLLQGGNAFDAAVATAVATTVVDPKNSTIGGQGFATIYVAAEKRVRALNFYGTSPQRATLEALTGKDYMEGVLSAPVPSNLKGYQALLDAYGSKSWAEVLAPAIELAERGYVFTAADTATLEQLADRLEPYPTSRAVYLPGGRVPRPGQVFVQRHLARTLKAIAADGPDVFYSGPIARRIADFFEREGGLLTYEDLAAYRTRWVEPISTTYRGYTLYTQPPNSSAIAMLIQLNLLEGFDLKALGHNTPEYLHLVGEVIRLALADRNRYVADPAFSDMPVEALLGKAYADERRRLIALDRTMPTAGPGRPHRKPEKEDTTHLTVVDAEGNMVALTQTLGRWFGSGVVVADTGVVFSNQMRHLHTEPDSPSRLEPGKQPRSNQSPTIVLKDGRPVMAIGTPGSDAIWQRLVQVIANMVDFGMDIQQAVAAPRMIYGGFQETGTDIPPIFHVENRIPPATVEALRARGFEVEVIPSDEGRLNGVVRDPDTGFLLGAADPRRLGNVGEWWGPTTAVYAIGW